MTTMDESWIAWLIESCDAAEPQYLRYELGRFVWTADPLAAIHFMRRQDAEPIAGERDEDVRVCEHEFC